MCVNLYCAQSDEHGECIGDVCCQCIGLLSTTDGVTISSLLTDQFTVRL